MNVMSQPSTRAAAVGMIVLALLSLTLAIAALML
jgi:hypothetical protein